MAKLSSAASDNQGKDYYAPKLVNEETMKVCLHHEGDILNYLRLVEQRACEFNKLSEETQDKTKAQQCGKLGKIMEKVYSKVCDYQFEVEKIRAEMQDEDSPASIG
ncbi:MAG: hypothetical protein Q9192_003135, partial [Flavoplaca navasiana]